MALAASELKGLCESSFIADLKVALNRLFMAADQAIIKLAQNSQDNAEQNRHFESVQGLRIARHELRENFAQGLLRAVAQDDGAQLAVDGDHFNSLRHLLSINPETWRANATLAANLVDLQQRIGSLAATLNNPLDPGYFVDSFLRSLAHAELDINTKMLVLRMFESQLYAHLEEYVHKANDELMDHGVLPTLKTPSSSLTASVDALVEATLGEAGQHRAGPSAIASALADLQANDYEVMDNLLSVERLAAWGDDSSPRKLLAEVDALLPNAGKLNAAEAAQREKIRLVERLFGILLADTNLPHPARGLLALLQLPYTRVALSDEDFFQQEKHPAKSLLNEITRLAAEWQPKYQDLARDEFFRKLSWVVQAFLEAERTEKIPYKDMLFELLAYAEGQRQKNVRASQRMLDSEYGAAASERARREVQAMLAVKMANIELAPAGRRIIEEGWSNVLYMRALQSGIDSVAWQQALKVVDDLLFTLRPAAEFSSRTELLGKLPNLLRSLREGLSSIHMSSKLINQLFADLEDAHKALAVKIGGEVDDAALELLKRVSSKPAERVEKMAPAPAPVSPPSVAPVVEPPPVAQPVEPATDMPSPVISEKTRGKLARLGPGVSLIWQRDNQRERCQVAAYIKHADKYILAGRSGAKLAEMLGPQMAARLESGEIELLESGQMFETALATVIGGLREKR